MKFSGLLAGLALALGAGHAGAQENCPSEPINVRFAHVGGTGFDVAVTAPGSTGPVELSWRSAEGTEDGPVDFLSGLAFRDAAGRRVAADYLGQGRWRLPPESGETWDGYSFRLTAEHDRAVWNIGKEEVAYRFDDGFYFVIHAVLPTNYEWGDCRFSVDFALPDDWQAVTPWAANADGTFMVDGLGSLVRNLVVLGPGLTPETFNIGDLEVTLIGERVFDDARPAFRTVLEQSLATHAEIFGGIPMERYLVAFGQDSMNDGGAFAQSFGQRLPAPFREHEALMWARGLTHESLHAWLGIAISRDPDAELQWFTEGATDYLTMKTLYRTELIDAHDVIFLLEGQLRRFLLGRIQSGPLSLAEAGENKQSNRMLVYGGGALFNLLLDARMTAMHGAGAYEDALRALYEAEDRRYSQARLLAVLDAHSDGAASEILDFLNGPFDPWALLAAVDEAGFSTSAFGPDELLVRFAANGCAGSRDPDCMPAYLRR